MKTLFVIFGVTGDLSRRKLLPALDSIVQSEAGKEVTILGVSRQDITKEETFKQYPRLNAIGDVFSMNLAQADEYTRLKKKLAASDADQVLFYLSVPPGAANDIVDFLGKAGLNTDRYKVLFEKPFGYDYESAKAFIEKTGELYKEEQLYRIDHYMAKSIAAELLRLRRNAENHHHTWGNESIAAVTVAATELIGVEGRGQFYEQTGALRDFLQGHLMQLLALVLADTPGKTTLAAERLRALHALMPADPSFAVRGQYEGYAEEVGNPGSTTETFAALGLESIDPHWVGVPLRLLTGKALAAKRSYVRIDYKDGTTDLFEEGAMPEDVSKLDAYERVLLEAMAGEKDIFTTGEEVLRSREIVAPVQKAWAMDTSDLELYKKGISIEGAVTGETKAE